MNKRMPLTFFFITFFLHLLICTTAFSQQKTPSELRRELARQKAERFKRFSMFESTQTANQENYDVKYYNLDLALDPILDLVSGSVTMTAEVISSSLFQVDLNLLNNMTVTNVNSWGTPLGFAHSNDILTITLPSTYAQGDTFSVTVEYNGTPDPGYGAFGFDTHNSDPMIWSLSEPYGARSWWPCKDIPSDKADSVHVNITVPSSLIVASNGSLSSVSDNGPTKTYHWRENYPISSYLVSVAAHPYTVFSDWYVYSPGDSMEVRYYVFPDHYATAQTAFAKTVQMIGLFSNLFGEYPFLNEKYGHAEFLWSGGMEHQTITSLGSYAWYEYIIAHELSHQWWGDMVTCNSFHHIWLNEGFATYSEALWSEFTYGQAQYEADMQAAKYLGPGTIYVADTTDWNRIFDSGLSYNKASWVLHMLRHVVGDSTFFQILKTYYSDPNFQYGTATTEGFRDLCESVSGMNLDWFFHQWIYEEFYPMYKYSWESTPNGGQYDINLTIEQLQSNYTFRMPIDITVDFAGGDTTLVVWDSLSVQNFTLTTSQAPTALHIDKYEWILRSIEEPIVHTSFDRGILLVNGVNFDIYGSEIWTAYEDSAFWGSYNISFWDCFNEPGSGYPGNLPAPLGHGSVPGDTLAKFSTVIWIGNNYYGDINMWYDTPIYSYLTVGGNVLLLTRMGQSFVTEPLREYLGITWRENAYNAIYSCSSAFLGLVDMAIIGSQSYCAVFDTSLATQESKLLFAESSTFPVPRGLGAWRKPSGGGTHRSVGGQFVFISGRPYRYDHNEMRANCEYILGNFFGEPYDATGIALTKPQLYIKLEQNYPNPFNPSTTIRFAIGRKGPVDLRIYDVSGRLVKTMISKELPQGKYKLIWNGRDNKNLPVSSGVYFCRLLAGHKAAIRKMVLTR